MLSGMKVSIEEYSVTPLLYNHVHRGEHHLESHIAYNYDIIMMATFAMLQKYTH